MMLFSTALPAAAFCSLLESHVGSRSEAWLLLRMKQRAMPLGDDNIGTWLSVFQIISTIAVATNAGLIVFTMDVLSRFADFSIMGQMWIFIGFQWFFFFMQSLIQQLIPDETDSSTMQAARQDFIVMKVLDQVADDDEDEVDDGTGDSTDNAKVKFHDIVQAYPEIELMTKV
jgi:Calcium-activated chloride channel